MKLSLGKGPYQIDIVKYYERTFAVMLNPEQFYAKIYPKIKVEILYTVIAFTLGVNFALYFLASLFGGDFSVGGLIGHIIMMPVITAIALGLGAIFTMVLSQLLGEKQLDFKESFRLTCFLSSWGFLCSVGWLQGAGALGLLITLVMALLYTWLGYGALRYYLRVSQNAAYVFVGLSVLALFMNLVTVIAANRTVDRLNKQVKKIEYYQKMMEKRRAH